MPRSPRRTDREALAERLHRPWDLPAGRWALRQRWCDLLFLHLPVPARQVAALVHPALEVDHFEGETFVGIVPFRMEDVAPGLAPAVSCLSAFPELNLRLYVRHRDRPGVWFVSLDAANPVAVRLARRWYSLPYHLATMRCAADGDGIDYSSRRQRGGPGFLGRYRPTAGVRLAARGSLEHWLTERYCLYTADRRGFLLRAEVQHPPWPLQSAEAEIRLNGFAASPGLRAADTRPLLHFARDLPVVAWTPRRIAGPAGTPLSRARRADERAGGSDPTPPPCPSSPPS